MSNSFTVCLPSLSNVSILPYLPPHTRTSPESITWKPGETHSPPHLSAGLVNVEITVPSRDNVTSCSLYWLATYILSPSGLTAHDVTVSVNLKRK
ncbi:hypothetical protein DPMN_117851 [Dreissena polymorpha]|uniref:Uncharacterized protein n=1 Tax=Dreissena polymorpha TaxID=45954 RepID=A0A9D4JQK9_DREPO|nr:hypothetical protein DPMN_117851 [Dreissena polymorpha]